MKSFTGHHIPMFLILLAAALQGVRPFSMLNALRGLFHEKSSANSKYLFCVQTEKSTPESCSPHLMAQHTQIMAQRHGLKGESVAVIPNAPEHQAGKLLASKVRRVVIIPLSMAFLYLIATPKARATIDAMSAVQKEVAFTETQSILIKGFISGACINLAKNIILHPIETVKARLDTGAKNDFRLFENVYSGIVPALLGGVPAAAFFFGTKDYCRSILRGSGRFGNFGPRLATILAVSVAQLPYWLLRNPSEVIKTRRRTRNSGQGNVDRDEAKAGLQIADLYSGFFTNLLYALPSDWLKFLSYEFVARYLFGVVAGEGVTVSGWVACVCGSLAALIAESVCTPLDVVRTRIMCLGKAEGIKAINPFTMLRNILENEGLGSLFKGWAPRSARALLDGAVQFVAYEGAQNMLRKHF